MESLKDTPNSQLNMDVARIRSALRHRFPNRIVTVDSHTAGEVTRLVVEGPGPLPGATMMEKLDRFRNRFDDLRLRLTREPRGHREMLAAVVTDPVSPEADFGLLYMDARRYPLLCGHATIGAVTSLVETGALPAKGERFTVRVDTPSGPMQAAVEMAGDRVGTVGIRMVPAFVYDTEQAITVPGFGEIPVDLVCVGGFFAMVPADRIGLDLTPENNPRLIDLGMAVIEAANQQVEIRHPTRPEVKTVDVTEFYDSTAGGDKPAPGVVVYGESHMDRSPCGTGTTAKMTLLHHHGHLPLYRPYLSSGPLGTVFEGRLMAEEKIGEITAVVAEIRGSAQITGIHEFVLDPDDPFPEGFLL